jgi:hypothetical protein
LVAEQTILITEAEAWTIDDLIRHTWVEDGKNVGQGLLLKVFGVLREFDARPLGTPDLLPIALTEEECWAIDMHLRRNHVDPMGVPVGRGLLLKVFGALLALRNAEAVRRLNLPDAGTVDDDPDARRRLDDYRRSLGSDGGEDQ